MTRISYTAAVVLSVIVLMIGCGSSHGTKSYPLGAFSVQVSGTGLSVIDQYGRNILPGSADTIEFGSATASVKEQFGSFTITETATWLKPDSFRVVSSDGNRMVIAASVPLGNVSVEGFITLAPFNTNMLGISVTAPAGTTATGQPINRIMLNLSCNSSDHYYGLGEQFNGFDQKGNIVAIWTQDHGLLENVYGTATDLQAYRHPTYFPEPFMLTSKPAGILISSTAYSTFDLCASDPNQASVELWDTRMQIILISDSDPIHIIRDFTGIVGRQPLSKPWVIGPWISVEGGSLSLTTIADQLRSKGIPSSALWYQDWVGGNASGSRYDLPYHWTPDYTLYPDMRGVNMTLNTMGFKALAYFNSFVDESEDQWNAAVTNGYLITDSVGQPYTFTGAHFSPESMVDLSNPSAAAWVAGFMQSATTLGFSGWMADFGEWLPYDSFMQSGPATQLHNEYPVLWARFNYDTMKNLIPDGDFAFFMRSGYLGSQPYQPVVWAGDQDTDFDPTFGLPTVIAAALNMGVSGVPIFTHDIAGFASTTPPSDQELYSRWTELGCFTPVMRTHNGLNFFTNWNWNSNSATIQMFKTYATLHVELLPYIYTYIEQAHEDGTPIMQALWLKYFNDPKTATIDDEYLFGDSMLVAPVITQGATTRTLYLPKGVWYPFNGGSTVAGGVSITVDAPEDVIPVFVPAGSIIPMLTQAPDTLITGTTSAGITTLADVITAQTVRVYPGGDSTFTVYDGSVFTLTSSSGSAGITNGVTLTGQNGAMLRTCASVDAGAVACTMVSGTTFSIDGSAGGTGIFTLQGTPADPAADYRIEVF